MTRRLANIWADVNKVCEIKAAAVEDMAVAIVMAAVAMEAIVTDHAMIVHTMTVDDRAPDKRPLKRVDRLIPFVVKFLSLQSLCSLHLFCLPNCCTF